MYVLCTLHALRCVVLYRSFKAIEGGFENIAMADLTGGVPNSITPLTENLDSIWNELKSLNSGGHLIGAVFNF